MALMLVALAVTGAGTLTLLRTYLEGQVDDKLQAAVQSAEQQRSFSQLHCAEPVVPTDYSVTVYYPGVRGRSTLDGKDPTARTSIPSPWMKPGNAG